MTQYSLVGVCQRFGETHSVHLQVRYAFYSEDGGNTVLLNSDADLLIT
jgi:hypothetical protein